MTGSAKTTRREFLTKACELSAAGFVTAFAWGSLSLRDANARWMPRPPGAVDGKDFLALCSRCGQCVTSCPYETLRLAGPFDPAPSGTPFFVPEEIPCYMCKDIPCVKACPTGALSPALTGISDARMGIAVVDPASCLSHQGLRCEVCYRACPEEEKALTIEMHPRGISRHAMFIPVVHPEHCTGCGLCTKSCPTGTPAIRIADRKAVLGEIGGPHPPGRGTPRGIPTMIRRTGAGTPPQTPPRLPPRAQAASTTSMRMRYEAALQHALDACPPRTSACGARALCGHGAPRVDARGRASP